MRGLSKEGNLRFTIDRASLTVGSTFIVFPLFYFVFGGLYLEGRFNGGFFALPVWGAYIWTGLCMEGLIFGILRHAKMRLSEVAIFMGLRGFFSVERIPKQNFKIIFAPKQKLNKIKFFDQHRLTPSENMQKWDYLKYLF